MVKTVFFIIILNLIFSGLIQANEIRRLTIEADKTELEMGKFLTVKLVYIGQNIPEPAQLPSWKKDFYIEEMSLDTEQLPQAYIKTTQKLRLYPLSTGKKTLHAIAQGGAIARPVHITILPVIRNNINGTPHWLSIPEEIWQGETIVVSVVINLMSADNQVKTEEPRFPGFALIKSWQKKIIHNGVDAISINWLLVARNYGYFVLNAPSVIQRGRGRWRFYLPEKTINIKPLPAYIPSTVPVAKLRVNTEPGYKNNQPIWRVIVTSKGQLPEEIYGLRTKLAEIGQTSPDKVLVNSSRRLIADQILFVQHYQLAVPQWSTGFDQNLLSLDFFNPSQGQLKQITINLPSVWLIPPLWWYFFIGLSLLMAGVISYFLFKLIKNYRHRKYFIRAVNDCRTPDELRLLVLQDSNSTTLSDWFIKSNINSIGSVSQQLNKLSFSGHDSKNSTYALASLKKDIIKNYRSGL